MKPCLKMTHSKANMRILILSNNYLHLLDPFFSELKNQGHTYSLINDKKLFFDCYDRKCSKFKRMRYGAIAPLLYRLYWIKQFHRFPELFGHYDRIIVIQGLSFHNILLKRLRKVNSKIKSVVYFLDSNNYYDFYRNAKYFDKVFTFDYKDAVEHPGSSFLPLYWVSPSVISSEIQYDISLIGTNHDNRLGIVLKLLPEIKKYKLKYCIKILDQNISQVLHSKKDELKDVLISDPLSVDVVNQIIAASTCVLDTDREVQTGLTPRLLWALANGKKVFTTNKNILDYPFYNEKQIMLIDRDDPHINVEFIRAKEEFDVPDYIKQLRIDNWINFFVYD